MEPGGGSHLDSPDNFVDDSSEFLVAAAPGVSLVDGIPTTNWQIGTTGSHDPNVCEAVIDDRLLSRLHLASCVSCMDGFCSPQPGTELASAVSGPGQRHKVIVDSGATRHMLPSRSMFTSVDDGVSGAVSLGDKNIKLRIEGQGVTNLEFLNKVLLVSRLSLGLLSVPQFDKDGFVTTLGRGKAIVRSGVTQEVMLTATLIGKLYVVDDEYMDLLCGECIADNEYAQTGVVREGELTAEQVKGSAPTKLSQTTAGEKPIDLIHRRHGHISEGVIKSALRTDSWVGAGFTYDQIKNDRLKFCTTCYEGKMKAFKRDGPSANRDAFAVGEKFGIDYKGKFLVRSVDGYNGFYLLSDYESSFLVVILVKSKNEAATRKVLDEFLRKVDSLWHISPTTMQCDYDTVLRSDGITNWLKEHNIKLQMSAPYTKWQNGFIEANIGKVMDMARTLMMDGSVPTRFWSYAVRHAVYLLNRTPTYRLDKTPLEVATGEKPDVSHLVPFWALGVYKKTAEERSGPWDAKAVKVRMVGIPDGTKNSYLCYEVGSLKKVVVRHDCIWDEHEIIAELGVDNGNGELADDDLAELETELRDSADKNGQSEDDAEAYGDEELPDISDDRYQYKYKDENESDLYWEHSAVAELVDWLDEIEERACEIEAQERGIELTPIVQPKTLQEALEGPDKLEWQKAWDTERNNFIQAATFRDGAAQKGHAMKTRILLKKSRRPDGSFKFKVRLVAKGFTQIRGVNYGETYAPTTSTSAVMMVLLIGAIGGRHISSFDVTAAFLEGKNDYPNFAWLPLEWGGALGGKRVEVVGNFYGEKQGPKIWNDRLNEILIEHGLERCPVQPCLYKKVTADGDFMFMCVHVDDGLLVTNSAVLRDEFREHLQSSVRQATFDDTVKKYIGIDVHYQQQKREVSLTHCSYITERWSNYTKDVDIPMAPTSNLRTATPVMRELTMLPDTGAFRFATDRGRPDVLVATGEIATGGDKNPSYEHEKVAERTKHYFMQTRDLGLVFGAGAGRFDELEIFGYSDAAYITQGNCKSRLGGCIFLNRYSGAIKSFSKTDTQRTDARSDVGTLSHSSTEAEIKAIDEWLREVIHIVDILEFLMGRRYDKPVVLYVDNKSAIELCNSLKQNHKVKHINMRIAFIRELIKSKFVVLKFVGTADNTADLLTKPLAVVLFTKHRCTLLTGHGGKLPSYSIGEVDRDDPELLALHADIDHTMFL